LAGSEYLVYEERHYEGTLRQIRMQNRTDAIKYNEQGNIEVVIPFETVITEGQWPQFDGEDREERKKLSDSIDTKMVTFEYAEDGWVLKNINTTSLRYDQEERGDAKRMEYE
jgi:hypothetical protein